MSSFNGFVSPFKVPETPMNYGLSSILKAVSLNEIKPTGESGLPGLTQLIFQ